MIPMRKRRMFNKYKSKNQNGKGIKIYSMEEPIVTFGSESLIIEMFPEYAPKPVPEQITFGSESLIIEMCHETKPVPEKTPEPLSPIPETIPETIPDTILQISPEIKKSWCVLS